MRRGGDARAWTRASLREPKLWRAAASAGQATSSNTTGRHTPEPVACAERRGTTPNHPEPGRETRQRRRYWRDARWESRSVRHPSRRGAVAARRAHNPKVGGSNPPAATIKQAGS